MAAIMGKDGSISIAAAVVGLIDTWSLNATLGAAEITQYGDPMRNYQNTIKEWSGTCVGTLAPADAQQIQLTQQATTAVLAPLALRFNTTGSQYWAGSAYVKSATIGSKVVDKVSVSIAFQGSSSLAFTS